MNVEDFRDYCLSKHGVTEETPFGVNTLVFKVGGKIFALADIMEFTSMNLKCDPLRAVELREEFEDIQPGFHMNKKHWNTVSTVGNLSSTLLRELIDHSYNLVLNNLPRSQKIALKISEEI